LNSGIHYGYSQVGKCFTVYPNNHNEAVELASQLDRLTAGVKAPAIPFDQKFGNDGCVYYRYGAFKPLEKLDANGKATLCIEDLEGNLIPDDRYARAAVPSWVVDPFASQAPAHEISSPLAQPDSSYMVMKALSQRGKGGVYLALDLTQTYPRLCLLKQGRKNGEQAWDGSDGFSRITNEEFALKSLAAAGVRVPKVFSTFTRGESAFIATEYVEGETLQKLLSTRARRLSIRRILEYGIQIGTLLNEIHAAGWVWRDCKPSNLIKTAKGEIRPIDFESAVQVNDSRPNLWATKAFSPPKTDNSNAATPPEDLYSFGVLLHFLLWGMLPNDENQNQKRRGGVPESLLELISHLMRENPTLRPDAMTATRRLREILITLPRLSLKVRNPANGSWRIPSSPFYKHTTS
jgi:serine/threonine protein kinase